MAPLSTSPCELSTVESSAPWGAVITLPPFYPPAWSRSHQGLHTQRVPLSSLQSSTHQVPVAQGAMTPWRFNNSQVCGNPIFKMEEYMLKKLEEGTEGDLAPTVPQTPFLSLDPHKIL